MPEGSLVAEYCGELVPVKEYAAREDAYHAAGLFYLRRRGTRTATRTGGQHAGEGGSGV
jgi:hypothetical protein